MKDFELFLQTILYLSIFSLGYSNPNNGIKLVTFDSIYYISASDFCSINNYDCPVYTDKSKIKINFLKGPAIFSINSSFINFNNQVYHMINKVKLKDNEFYIPYHGFFRVLEELNFLNSFLDPVKDVVLMELIRYNISEISLLEKEKKNKRKKILAPLIPRSISFGPEMSSSLERILRPEEKQPPVFFFFSNRFFFFK